MTAKSLNADVQQNHAAETTRFDLARRLPDPVTLPALIAALDDTQERIGALLDGDRWWQQS